MLLGREGVVRAKAVDGRSMRWGRNMLQRLRPLHGKRSWVQCCAWLETAKENRDEGLAVAPRTGAAWGEFPPMLRHETHRKVSSKGGTGRSFLFIVANPLACGIVWGAFQDLDLAASTGKLLLANSI